MRVSCIEIDYSSQKMKLSSSLPCSLWCCDLILFQSLNKLKKISSFAFKKILAGKTVTSVTLLTYLSENSDTADRFFFTFLAESAHLK